MADPVIVRDADHLRDWGGIRAALVGDWQIEHQSGYAVNYGVVDEIAGRALRSGTRVMAVRKVDLPAGQDLAAILRYPL